jgi:D-erythronate 2-dehydrogenase
VHVLILGAAGMIGRKLTGRLVADGNIRGRALERLTLVDVVPPQRPAGAAGQIDSVAADLADPGEAEHLLEGRPELIFHLAAVVSGEAETDFEKGYRVNLDGTRALLEAVRAAHTADGYHPRLVLTSSIAVYGAPLPNPIPEDFHETPLTSYGTQKAIGELLLAVYTRRGFLGPPPASSPAFCASLWSGRRRSYRFRRRSGTGTRRPAQQWSSWSGRPRSTVRRSVRDARCPCPVSAQP